MDAIEESFAADAQVSEVARKHSISPQHLFPWRKAAKDGRLVLPLDDGAPFASVLVEGPGGGGGSACRLELEVGCAMIRVSAETDLTLLSTVVALLKAPR